MQKLTVFLLLLMRLEFSPAIRGFLITWLFAIGHRFVAVGKMALLVGFISLCACDNNSDNPEDAGHHKRTRQFAGETGSTQFGLAIENGPRQGFQYLHYDYRYFTITITNDTTLPVQLEIGLLERELKEDSSSNVFLLPRRLTPKEQHFDQSMSDELRRFLEFEIDKKEHLSSVVNPSEKCVLTFGVLTDTKYPNPTTPFGTQLLTSKENESKVSCWLKLNEAFIIPCGHIEFIHR